MHDPNPLIAKRVLKNNFSGQIRNHILPFETQIEFTSNFYPKNAGYIYRQIKAGVMVLMKAQVFLVNKG